MHKPRWTSAQRTLEYEPSATGLDLSDLDISDKEFVPLVENTSLLSLDIRYNEKLSHRSAVALAASRTLQSLSIGFNNIGCRGVELLALNSHLTRLDIRCIDLDYRSIAALASQRLSTLALVSCGVTDPVIATLLSENSSLTSLDVGRNFLTASSVDAFLSKSSLGTLDVKCNRLAGDGAEKLASHPGLTSLNLYSNPVNERGIRALALNSSLKRLNISLSLTQAGNDSVAHFAANSSLTELQLGNNDITDASVGRLADNTTLNFLDLSYNPITNVGAQSLARNSTLTSLVLESQQITDVGATAFLENTTLTHLDLRYITAPPSALVEHIHMNRRRLRARRLMYVQLCRSPGALNALVPDIRTLCLYEIGLALKLGVTGARLRSVICGKYN